MKRLGVVVAVALLVAGCGSSDVPNSSVAWDDYDSTLKSKIDGYADDSDCAALQEQFDVADQNNGSTRERTGHGNVELMDYINGKLTDAGCYS